MNKRIFTILIGTIIIISLASCGNKNENTAQVSQAFEIPAPTDVPGTIANVFTEDDFEEIKQPSITAVETEQPSAPPTEATDSVEETPAPTSSPAESPENNPITAPSTTAYEQYNAMSGDEQIAFMESFDSVDAFVAWYNAAQAEYNASRPAIEVEGGVIDMSEIISGTN